MLTHTLCMDGRTRSWRVYGFFPPCAGGARRPTESADVFVSVRVIDFAWTALGIPGAHNGTLTSPSTAANQTAELVASHSNAITEARYLFSMGPLMQFFREGSHWRWADSSRAKALLDEAFLALVGPRVPEDDVREAEAKEAKKAAGKVAKVTTKDAAKTAAAAAPSTATAAAPAVAEEGVFVARELASAVNTPELIAAHKAVSVCVCVWVCVCVCV